jgi:hypothetical protein
MQTRAQSINRNHEYGQITDKQKRFMKFLNKPLRSRVWLYQNTLIAILLAGSAGLSEAATYTIGTRNSSMQIDLAGGITQWTVNGVNQLNLQTFYYSVGSGPAVSIYTLGLLSGPTITTNISKTEVDLNATYGDSTIGIGTLYMLTSSPLGSSQSRLGQTLTINNPTASTQVYHFYQYSDFELGGASGSQSLQFYSNGFGQYYQVVQTASSGTILTGLVTAVTGGISAQAEVQAGLYDGNNFGLGGGNPVTLNNTLTAGPGNAVYAYEWDVTLAAGTSLTISEIQTVVPEPSSVALVASGILGLALLRRRRQRGSRQGHSV